MGDEEKEGPGCEVKAERQLLHAWKLGLFHPKTNEWMEFEAPLPADFMRGALDSDPLFT